MATLKELLDDLEIDTKDDKEDKPFDIEKIPEEHRPAYQKIIDEREALTNDVASRELVIKTLRESQKEPDKKVNNDDDEEKDRFGLEKDDKYAPLFGKMFDAINGLVEDRTVNAEEKFTNDVKDFAKENKDIVRYASDMDAIAKDHPTLKADIPKLYQLAKDTKERRDKLQKKTVVTEKSGESGSNVVDIQQAKTIGESFSLAEKTLGGK